MQLELYTGQLYSTSWTQPHMRLPNGGAITTAPSFCSFELRRNLGWQPATIYVGDTEQLNEIVKRFPDGMTVYLTDERDLKAVKMPVFLSGITYGCVEGVARFITPGLPEIVFHHLDPTIVRTLLHPILMEQQPRELYIHLSKWTPP